MRRPLLRAFPRAGTPASKSVSHVCERYGWTHASIASYRTTARFDLVICYDVLQYLDRYRSCARDLANLGRLTRGALFLHVPTLEDWERNADRSCSDDDIHLRSTIWYRTRLARRFRHAGFGLYVRRSVPLLQWELARAEHREPGSIEQKGSLLFRFGHTQEKPKSHRSKTCHFLARCHVIAMQAIAFFHAGFTPRTTVLSRGGLNLRHMVRCDACSPVGCLHSPVSHPAERVLRKQHTIPRAAVMNVIPVAAFIRKAHRRK